MNADTIGVLKELREHFAADSIERGEDARAALDDAIRELELRASRVEALQERLDLTLASIQRCKNNHSYMANRHGYPCPWCMLQKLEPNSRQEEELIAIHQAIADPENQPSQFGTVTITMHDALQAELANLYHSCDENDRLAKEWCDIATKAQAERDKAVELLRRCNGRVGGKVSSDLIEFLWRYDNRPDSSTYDPLAFGIVKQINEERDAALAEVMRRWLQMGNDEALDAVFGGDREHGRKALYSERPPAVAAMLAVREKENAPCQT